MGISSDAYADLGMKVSKDRISLLLKLAREQQAQQQAMPEQPSVPEYSQPDATANEWHFWETATYQTFQIGGC